MRSELRELEGREMSDRKSKGRSEVIESGNEDYAVEESVES